MANFQRAPNRLDPASYLGFQEYFLTLCTGGRQNLFANRALVDALLATLRETSSVHHFAISAYCFMPDHLHLLAQAKSKTCDLPVFVKVFKGRAAVAARRLGIRNLYQRLGSGSWNPDLKTIERCYESGQVFPPSIRSHSQTKDAVMPANIAAKIMESPEKFPGAMVRLPEERCRREVAKGIVPVAQVADQERWFA